MGCKLLSCNELVQEQKLPNKSWSGSVTQDHSSGPWVGMDYYFSSGQKDDKNIYLLMCFSAGEVRQAVKVSVWSGGVEEWRGEGIGAGGIQLVC